MTTGERQKVSWISVECLILLKNRRENKKCGHEEVASEFIRLSNNGIEFHGLGLRKIPGGFMSEDVLGHLWQLCHMGYCSGNPHSEGLILTSEGERWCKELLQGELKENNEEFRSVAAALDIDSLLVDQLMFGYNFSLQFDR